MSIKLKKNHTHNGICADIPSCKIFLKSYSHTVYLIYVAISVEIVFIAGWIIMA